MLRAAQRFRSRLAAFDAECATALHEHAHSQRGAPLATPRQREAAAALADAPPALFLPRASAAARALLLAAQRAVLA